MTRRGWGVLLDRDGTLVPDVVHPTRPGDLRFYAGTAEALRRLSRAGAVLAVVSNQSAVARGLLDLEGLGRLDRRLHALARRAGAPLAAAYYCPHHPDVTGPCSCRKPAPGMIRAALRDLRLDPRRSFLIGDTVSDLEAGRRGGVRPVLVLTGRGRAVSGRGRRLAEHVARDVLAAARWIEREAAGS
jgi:D-glycero-D-manno-heptose 1,7-bisphosphate phosphatase